MTEQTSEMGGEAQAIVERLSTVEPSRPVDRVRVESALGDYLEGLGLDPRPITWIEADDSVARAREGFIAAWARLQARNKGRPLSVGMTMTPADKALHGARLWEGGPVGAAKKEVKKAGFGTSRAAHKMAKTARDRLDLASRSGARVLLHHDLLTALEGALNEKGLYRKTSMTQAATQTSAQRAAAQDAELEAEVAIGDAAHQAGEAACWLAQAHVLEAAGKPTEAVERVARAYLPLVDAVEAGLWLFWVTDDDVVAVATSEPRPHSAF
jgi:hypothetical protein